MAKLLELLKELMPRTPVRRRPLNPDNLAMGGDVQAMESTAGSLEVELRIIRGHVTERARERLLKDGQEAHRSRSWCRGGNIQLHVAALADLAATKRLPSAGVQAFAEAGGLIGYGLTFPTCIRRARYLVDKILKGAKPADLPVEQPTKFELVINLKTAKALGLTIPPSLLARADQIIE